jgi:hypothetical protein
MICILLSLVVNPVSVLFNSKSFAVVDHQAALTSPSESPLLTIPSPITFKKSLTF